MEAALGAARVELALASESRPPWLRMTGPEGTRGYWRDLVCQIVIDAQVEAGVENNARHLRIARIAFDGN